MTTPASSSPATTRDVDEGPLPVYPEYVDRWAIVVGISQYAHTPWNLQYAAADAEAVAALLATPAGGAFAADHIRKLTDAQATTTAITRALRSFLKKPAPQDIVLLYFACHGGPDPDRPGTVYLLTYDTDPADIAGTALPMREIDAALHDNLLAERIVILADACHSAAIGSPIGGSRAGDDTNAVVNSYLQQLSQTKKGTAMLTAATAAEVSREAQQWGHGVFTYYLLEGMKGAAEQNGVVTLGALADYVTKNVKEATGDSQHPVFDSRYADPRLPMAITGGATAGELYRLGADLFELGRLLDDLGRYRAAAAQLQEAARLAGIAGEALPQADLLRGRAWLGLSETAGALAAFARAGEPGSDGNAPQAGPAAFYTGLAHAGAGHVAEALAAFGAFLQAAPAGPNAAWVRDYMAWLGASGDKYAVLIGVGQFGDPSLQKTKIPGTTGDTALLAGILKDQCGFPADTPSC